MRILWSVLLLLFFVPGWMGEPRVARLGHTPHMRTTRVLLDPAPPGRTRVGDLVFLGGIQLSDPDPAFGGFSSLTVQGDRVTLLSDSGDIVRFRLDSDWRVHDIHYAGLPAGPGDSTRKGDRDSESMSVDPASGDIWVGFENSNSFWRYDAGFTTALGHVAPPTMRGWPFNEGPEAMTVLPGGDPTRYLATIAETTHWPHQRGRGGIVFRGDPIRHPRTGFRFNYIPPAGYDPSDMTILPDGRWLILNRSFSPWQLRFGGALTIVDPARVRPGATVRGRVIADISAPLIHDNWEGVTVTREGAATILWLVSDDNQAWPLERSLLLKFRLEPAAPAVRRTGRN